MNDSGMCCFLEDINFIISQSKRFRKANNCTVVSSLMTKGLRKQEENPLRVAVPTSPLT